MEPKNRRNLTMENLTWRNSKEQKSGKMQLCQNYLFIEVLKKMDKESHHEGHTQKACNPSINAPTNVHLSKG